MSESQEIAVVLLLVLTVGVLVGLIVGVFTL